MERKQIRINNYKKRIKNKADEIIAKATEIKNSIDNFDVTGVFDVNGVQILGEDIKFQAVLLEAACHSLWLADK